MNKEKLKNAAGPVFVVSAGILWGMIGIFVRRLGGYGLDSMQVVAVRVAFAAILTAVVLLVKDRSLFRIKLKDLWCFIGTGVCSIAFFNFCYFDQCRIGLCSLPCCVTLPETLNLSGLWVPKNQETYADCINILQTEDLV